MVTWNLMTTYLILHSGLQIKWLKEWLSSLARYLYRFQNCSWYMRQFKTHYIFSCHQVIEQPSVLVYKMLFLILLKTYRQSKLKWNRLYQKQRYQTRSRRRSKIPLVLPAQDSFHKGWQNTITLEKFVIWLRYTWWQMVMILLGMKINPTKNLSGKNKDWDIVKSSSVALMTLLPPRGKNT